MNMQTETLAADRGQIEQFVGALFRYASEGGVVSLRAFDDRDKSAPPFAIKPVTINGAGLAPVTEAAVALATRCARARAAIVFCPPVVTFKDASSGEERNVAEGVALSVECDATPATARARLEAILGPATVVIASGGEWTDPETGEVQDKLHLHWRLTEPTQTAEDHARLKEARRLATALVGSDATAVPLVHPLRWPGSWHRKAAPRLARIVALADAREVELAEALEALQEAAGAAGQASGGTGTGGAQEAASGPRIDTGDGFTRKTPEDYSELLAACARDGWKHHAVVRLAASLAAQGCSETFAAGVIRHHCPVWDRGVEEAIRSGFANFRKEQAEASVADADPVDLWGQFDPPELPAGLLPPAIEDFARVQGERMGADPAGLAVAALVTCAAAIPDAVQIKVKVHDDWTESPRLWAALVGSPSTKKSPILSAATSPLCRLDAEMFRQWRDDLAEFNALPKEERAGRTPPPQRRLRIEDATVEAAQQVLEGSPWGVLLLQDELSGFFGQMDKYNGGKGASADRAFWLRSFNGGEYALNRVGRGAALIPNLSVCLLGGIQPEPIRRVAGDAHDDGLLQRLFPIVLRPATMGTDSPAPAAAEAYRDLVERLRQTRPPGWMGLQHVTFDAAGQEVRRTLEAEHLRLQSLEAINRKLAAHIGKLDGLFARLCLVWHCIEHAEQENLPETIGEATARRVGRFLHKFLLRHALAFYSGVLDLSDDHDRLTALAGFILAKRKEVVTNRDVAMSVCAMRGLEERDVRRLFEQLEALGWLAQMPGPRPSSPPQWLVNPAVHQKFAGRARQEVERRREVQATIRQTAEARKEDFC